MDDTLLGIGQMAKASGLTVSALRFYAGSSVLVPAFVDPTTGYRSYRPAQLREARLIAQLRRVAMPLREIRQILTAHEDPAEVAKIIERHLHRLEAGLADAKRVLSTVQHLLHDQEEPMPTTATVTTDALAGAAQTVAHAIGDDPEYPMLRGVLVEIDSTAHTLRLVATDRHRLSVTTINDCTTTGPDASLLAPSSLLDTLQAHRAGGEVTMRVDGDLLTINDARFDALSFEFPAYQRVLREDSAYTASVDAGEFRSAVEAAATRTVDGVAVVPMAVNGAGKIALQDDPDAVVQLVVNREFLLQAAQSISAPHLVLDLDGPLAPLALRNETGSTLTMVMPVREG